MTIFDRLLRQRLRQRRRCQDAVIAKFDHAYDCLAAAVTVDAAAAGACAPPNEGLIYLRDLLNAVMLSAREVRREDSMLATGAMCTMRTVTMYLRHIVLASPVAATLTRQAWLACQAAETIMAPLIAPEEYSKILN